jgi:hypothetical protein
MPSLLEIAQRISTIVLSKWFVDIHHFADCIGISVDKVPGSFNALKTAVIRGMSMVVGIQIPLHMTKRLVFKMRMTMS